MRVTFSITFLKIFKVIYNIQLGEKHRRIVTAFKFTFMELQNEKRVKTKQNKTYIDMSEQLFKET